MKSTYENQKFYDSRFPIKFHTDRLYKTQKAHNYSGIKYNLPDIYLHWHEGLELLRIKKGSCRIFINLKEYTANENQTVVIAPNSLHKIEPLSDDCIYDCLGIDSTLLNEWGFDGGQLDLSVLVTDAYFCDVFNKIRNEYTKKLAFYKPLIISASLEILSLLCRNYRQGNQKNDTAALKKISAVQKIMAYISAHIESDDILNELSNELTYSKFYISHIFKEVTGMTVKEFQLRQRFNKAKEMLLKTDLTVTEIAESLGYINATSFSSEFKRRFKITPLAYKEHKQNG